MLYNYSFITFFQGWALILGNLKGLWFGFIYLTYSWVGVPKIFTISTNWSTALSPWNKGSYKIISARTHPIDQTSIDIVYSTAPKINSGAR